MAIQQTKKQSDLEKRLQLLRRQVYGGNKDQSSAINYQLPDKKQEGSNDQQPAVEKHLNSDLTYLHQDLLKILIFASLAIGTQIILFILYQSHLLTLSKLLFTR